MSFKYASYEVEIYTLASCGYCICAKRLLEDKNIEFIEYAIDGDEQARRQMMLRADGRSSVPQIFINGRGIGGFYELQELEESSQLDELLNGDIEPDKTGNSGVV